MQMNSNNQKPTFDWRKFKYENIAVHVKTQEEYDNFMKECKAQGLTWCTGKEVDKINLWPDCAYDMCIVYDNSGLVKKGLHYQRLGFFKDTGCRIEEFANFYFPKDYQPLNSNSNLIPEEQIEFLKEPTTHTLKLEECFCEAVVTGKKCFEIRKNDRGFQPGDTIEFIPVSNGLATINVISNHRYRITYVLSGWGLKNGYVAFGIEEVKRYD